MIRLALLLTLLSCTLAMALPQEQQPSARPPETPNRALISPAARLKAAKTAYLKNGGGSEIPFNVIENGLEGWPHFVLVDSPEQADVIIQVDAPYVNGGVTVSSSDSQSAKNVKNYDVDDITLRVIDAKTHLPLWSSVEHPKGGFKERTRDDNLVQASERLFDRLRARLEPPPADTATEKKQ